MNSTAGFQAVLLKPITSSSIQDALASVLSSARDAPEAAAAPAADDEARVREHHAGQRILLAEDNPVNREVAEALLGSAGLIVESAWDGARAVELALSRHFDLALMDLQMPWMDGLEAAREIRRQAGFTLPIIAMTANAFAEDRLMSLEAGMNDHLGKPVDPAVLYAMLLRWLPLRPGSAVTAADPGFGARSLDDLRERLSKVEGIDLGSALRSVAGQMMALSRVLRRFISTYSSGLPGLLDTSGDGAERHLQWQAICHSVRTALGAVGATDLASQAKSLETALSGVDSVAQHAQLGSRLHNDVLSLAEELHRVLAEDA